MVNYTNETAIKLSGHWNLSGVVHQIGVLPTLNQLESGQEKHFRIDCSEISSVDMSGLQLLQVWMQCLSLHGVKPELINLPEVMQRTIKQLRLERTFSDFYMDAGC
jgi:anti-anti-sigma regulatory factor